MCLYKNTVKDFNMYNTLVWLVGRLMWYNNINTVIPPPHYSPNSLKELRLLDVCVNDPSAGSPTETLLRLLLPLNDKVQATSRR